MTEIVFQISVNDQNDSIPEVRENGNEMVSLNSDRFPSMIDAIMKEESPLGDHLRKIVKTGGYSISFNIEIKIASMTKSKMRRLKRKQKRMIQNMQLKRRW